MSATDTPIVSPAVLSTLLGPPPPPSEPGPGKMAVVYIAGPFSGADGWEIAENVHAANRIAREVTRLRAAPITPHAIGAQMAGTETYEFWCAATLEMMRRCDAVLFTHDWRRSPGARGEHEEALRRRMPIFYTVDALAAWLAEGWR